MSFPPEIKRDLEDAFFLFAYDESRKVSVREVGAVIRSVGLNPTEEELKQMQAEVQKQFGGQCDVNGLAKILAPRLNSLRTEKQELRDALLIFDKNGNGMISVSDLMHSLTSLGERLSPEICDEMIREVDTDGQGEIPIESVVELLLKK